MAPQVGLVSGRLEEKEYGFKPGSRVYAGPDWGWQTQESYNKTVKMRRGGAFFDWMATNIGDPIKAAISPVVQAVAPVVQPVAEAVSGIIQSTPVIGPLTEAVGTTTETLRKEATQRGIDPRVADVAMMAGEELVGGVVGKTLGMASKVINNLPGPPTAGLAMAGGAPMPTPRMKPTIQNGTFKLTITEPEFIAPGIRQGIAETPANLKARQMLDKSIERLDKRRSQLEADVKSGKIEYKSTRWKGKDKKIREERYGEMSSFYNQLDQDPPAFNVAGEKHIDPTDITMKAEQHHLAAKAQTAPFIEAMLSVGDPDDLVALHEYSRMLGVVMGNSKRNMLDAPGPIHRAAVAKTAQEKAGNIHSAFSVAGMEPNNAFVKNLLKDVKTADDVMRVFKQYADEYLIPQQDIAKKIVKNYLSDYRIKLTPAQKAKFDELASKLN
jgi:hypothetical protein